MIQVKTNVRERLCHRAEHWPVLYGEIGVLTFFDSHNSDAYEKDLGPDTAKQAAMINVFNPDNSREKADMTA